MPVTLVHETAVSPSTVSGSVTIPSTTAGNLIVVLATGYQPSQKWVSPTFVTSNVDGVLNQVPFWSLQGGSAWDWGTFSGSSCFGDISYIVTAGGATSISFQSNGNIDGMWVYEVSGVGGSTLDSFAQTGAAGNVPVFGPALSGTSGGDLLIQLVTLFTRSTTGISSPWVWDTHNLDGNGPAYILGGNGTQAAPQWTVTSTNTDHYWAGAVAFSGGTPASPTIVGSSSSCAGAGDSITITGTGFGSSQGGSVVTVGGTTASVVSWSNTSITFTFPTITPASTYSVMVIVGGVNSNTLTLTGCLQCSARGMSVSTVSSPNVVGSINYASDPTEGTWTAGDLDTSSANSIVIGHNSTYYYGASGGRALSGNDSLNTYAIRVNGSIVSSSLGGTDIVVNGSLNSGDVVDVVVTSGTLSAFTLWVAESFGVSGVQACGGSSSQSTNAVGSTLAVPVSGAGPFATSATGSGGVPVLVFPNDYALYLISGSIAIGGCAGASGASQTQVASIFFNDFGGGGIGGPAVTRAQSINTTVASPVTLSFNTLFRGKSSSGAPGMMFCGEGSNPVVGQGCSSLISLSTVTVTRIWNASACCNFSPSVSGSYCGKVGTQITLNGSGFGETQGAGNVTIGGTNASVVSWSNTVIVFIIPDVTDSTAVVTNSLGQSTSFSLTLCLSDSIRANTNGGVNGWFSGIIVSPWTVGGTVAGFPESYWSYLQGTAPSIESISGSSDAIQCNNDGFYYVGANFNGANGSNLSAGFTFHCSFDLLLNGNLLASGGVGQDVAVGINLKKGDYIQFRSTSSRSDGANPPIDYASMFMVGSQVQVPNAGVTEATSGTNPILPTVVSGVCSLPSPQGDGVEVPDDESIYLIQGTITTPALSNGSGTTTSDSYVLAIDENGSGESGGRSTIISESILQQIGSGATSVPQNVHNIATVFRGKSTTNFVPVLFFKGGSNGVPASLSQVTLTKIWGGSTDCCPSNSSNPSSAGGCSGPLVATFTYEGKPPAINEGLTLSGFTGNLSFLNGQTVYVFLVDPSTNTFLAEVLVP